MTSDNTPSPDDLTPPDFQSALSKVVSSGSRFKTFIRAFMQTVASALSAAPGGLQSIIFGLSGGTVSAVAGFWAESDQASANALFVACLEKHEEQFTEITGIIYDVGSTSPVCSAPGRQGG